MRAVVGGHGRGGPRTPGSPGSPGSPGPVGHRGEALGGLVVLHVPVAVNLDSEKEDYYYFFKTVLYCICFLL